MNQLARLLLILFYTAYFVAIVPLSLWLLFNAQSWVGRGLAVIGVLSLVIPLLLTGYLRQREQRKAWGWSAAVLAAGMVGFFVAVVIAAPSGSPGTNSPVQHRFFRERGFNRFSLTNLIPESEQVNLGFLLMTFLDPYITVEQAGRVAPTTMALYKEMEQDENFHELGSVMGHAYGQLFGLPFDAGHYYLYVPESARSGGSSNSEPLPALVFLHGSAGNFKTYTWLWSTFAEQEGFVIIAPSYGFGVWDEQGIETAVQALEDARKMVNIDEERLYLAGLSNGGIGVSRIAVGYPELFEGLIFLSPVFDTGIVDGDAFHGMWAERPVLVISGEADKRIPLDYVKERAAVMQNGGIDVTSVFYPGEDHFLTFSQPDRIMTDVAVWINDEQSGR